MQVENTKEAISCQNNNGKLVISNKHNHVLRFFLVFCVIIIKATHNIVKISPLKLCLIIMKKLQKLVEFKKKILPVF